MRNLALLIIDMQNALVAGAYRERDVLDRIGTLASRMRSARQPVIYIQHNHASFTPMMKGEPGWSIHPDLEPCEGDVVLEKEASDAFYGTALQSNLRRLNVETVLISGMQTEYCIDTTARSALVHGFDVILLTDSHTTGDAGLTAHQIIEHHNSILPNVVHPTRTITAVASTEVKLATPSQAPGQEDRARRVIEVSEGAVADNVVSNQPVIAAIHAGLEAFNAATRPDPNARPVTLAVYGDEQDVVAGLLGRIAYGWLRVDVVWVSETLRGHGIGRELITRAEQIARDRGCHGVHLDTHEFQAPGFYERMGYQRFGELEDYPEPEVHGYYVKRLP